MKLLSAILFSLLASGAAQAIQLDLRGDPVRIETVKSRLYPGGIDEEDLRVQPQVITPLRKIDTKGIQSQVLKTPGRIEMIEEGGAGQSPPAQ